MEGDSNAHRAIFICHSMFQMLKNWDKGRGKIIIGEISIFTFLVEN